MTIKEIAVKTRSIRRFREEEMISGNKILEFIDAARLAPNAANLQQLRYSVITDTEKRIKIFPAIKWAGYLKNWSGPAEGERPAAYVIIHGPAEEKKFTRIDVGIAAAYIVLAARESGVGSCIIMSFDERILQNTIEYPYGYRSFLLIAFGTPAENVVIEEVGAGGNIEYWRDESGVHHVPKRKLKNIIIP